MNMRHTSVVTIPSTSFLSRLVVGLCLCIPFSVLAAPFSVHMDGNVFSLAGECEGSDVLVQLRHEENGEMTYTSHAECLDERFAFTDDLGEWNIPDGRYELYLDGERVRRTIERVPVAVKDVTMDEDTVAKTDTADSVETASIGETEGFLGAFVAFQQALTDMRSRLNESDYPDMVKMSLDIALDGIDTLAGTMTDRLFAEESADTEGQDFVTTHSTIDSDQLEVSSIRSDTDQTSYSVTTEPSVSVAGPDDPDAVSSNE